MSVYEVASNVITNNAKGIATANKEAYSFNRVLKVMKSKGVYEHLAEALSSVGIGTAAELTLKNVRSKIAPELTKVVERKNEAGEKVQMSVVCTIRKRYESDEVNLMGNDGKPLCKVVNGKAVPRTQKVVRLDEEGEKVIKDYILCEVKSWNIALVLTLLAQSKAIREGVK